MPMPVSTTYTRTKPPSASALTPTCPPRSVMATAPRHPRRAFVLMGDGRHILDDRLQAHGAPDDDFHLLVELLGDELLEEGGMAQDHTERGAELGGGNGDEVRLHAVETHQVGVGFLQACQQARVLDGNRSLGGQRL